MKRATAPPIEPRWGPDGLIPAIAQDARDGRVLMLAWMDAEAWRETVATNVVHFHSRSRDRLWRKGETSGNELGLVAASLDCDSDAVLLAVDPLGSTCHRGTRSCFDDEPAVTSQAPLSPQGFAWLETLWATISSRAADRPEGSWTGTLVAGGVDATTRKVTEEATEVLIAAKDDAVAEEAGADRTETRRLLAEESADLLYHALVALAERGLAPADVLDVLRTRHRP